MSISSKFVFKELSSDSVVETLKKSENIDEKIREAVIAHLSDVIEPQIQENGKKQNALILDKDITEIKALAYKEGYDAGFAESKITFDNQLSELNQRDTLIQNLNTTLSGFLPLQNPVGQYVELMGLAIEELANKLFLDLTSNHEQIIKKQLKNLLDSCYQGGKVVIKVNEKNLEFCKNLVDRDYSNSKFELIEVVAESDINYSDCIVEYNDTKLIFDRNLVKQEIEEIVKHFTLDSQ